MDGRRGPWIMRAESSSPVSIYCIALGEAEQRAGVRCYDEWITSRRRGAAQGANARCVLERLH